MPTWLNGYGPSNLEALLALALIAALVLIGYWRLRRRARREAGRLESALAGARRQVEEIEHRLAEAERQHGLDEVQHRDEMEQIQRRSDPGQIKEQQDHLQRVIAHEFVKGLHFISSKSGEALAGLRTDQPDLRDQLNEVRAKAYEMTQHAKNVVGLPDLERDSPPREMVGLRGVLEGALKELFPYAEAQGVHLQVRYSALGPILASRHLLHQLCSNLIHNAIKYSPPGSAVSIALKLEDGDEKQAVIEIRDRGRGIDPKDRERHRPQGPGADL